MLNRWFKFVELTPFSVDSTIRNSRMASTSGCDQPATSSATDLRARGAIDDTDCIDSTITVTPAAMPFRKKAITSIERTRKLSILLKHQRYLVSGKNSSAIQYVDNNISTHVLSFAGFILCTWCAAKFRPGEDMDMWNCG